MKEDKKYIFICGLHRSGTTALHDILAANAGISSFKNTGVPMNEGQFLQSVYSTANKHGGPGKFSFSKKMHLTEKSNLLIPENIKKLNQEWDKYWDNSKNLFLEKSPPNILKSRFLQKVFPNSYFILVKRHPLATSYATKKWAKSSSLLQLIKHWLTAYQLFLNDKEYLNKVIEIKYEDFVNDPERIINDLSDFLEEEITLPKDNPIRKEINQTYFNRWGKENKLYRKLITSIYESKINEFGYSFIKF